MESFIKNWKKYWSVYLVVGLAFIGAIYLLSFIEYLIDLI